MQEFNDHGTRILIGGRQTGKTEALVKWAQEDPRRLVIVPTHREAADLVNRRGITAGGVDDIRVGGPGGGLLGVAFDRVLECLVRVTGVYQRPAVVTLDGDPVEPQGEYVFDATTPAELLLEAARYYRDENARLRLLLTAALDDRELPF